MDIAYLGSAFEPGQPKESIRLFDGPGYVVATITLRTGAAIPTHVAKDPIVVTCVAGSGEFIAGEGAETARLSPGTVLALPAGVPHSLRASHELRVVVVRITGSS